MAKKKSKKSKSTNGSQANPLLINENTTNGQERVIPFKIDIEDKEDFSFQIDMADEQDLVNSSIEINKVEEAIILQNGISEKSKQVVQTEMTGLEQVLTTKKKRGKKRKLKQIESHNESNFMRSSDPKKFLPTDFVPACKFNDNLPNRLMKYWNKRERLFSKYNEGIWMDQEGWYSVTPEKVAKHIANRMKCDVIIDGFCGVGGNAIQFAMTCNHVIAIEKDPIRLACAKHNAEIYNVSHKIDFILGDYFEVIKTLKADCIFLSPPWGGPKYSKSEYFDLTTMMPFDGIDLFNISRQITPNIAYFLPRNSDYDQLGELVQDEECEIEEEYASYSFVAVTAYYGPKLLSNSS